MASKKAGTEAPVPASARSGGARRTERKRRAQGAQRGPRYNQAHIAQFKRIKVADKSAAGALDEAVQTLRAAMRLAATDPGMPPEYCREQAARIALSLAKAAAPRKLIDELAAELRAAYEVMEALKVQHGAQEPSPDPRRAAPAPH